MRTDGPCPGELTLQLQYSAVQIPALTHLPALPALMGLVRGRAGLREVVGRRLRWGVNNK